LFCSPSGERKRWAGLPPCRRQLKVTVRIFVKKGSDFVQKVPPTFNFRVFGDYCLALASLGLGRSRDFEGIFEIQKQFLPAQTEVCFGKAKSKTKFCKPIFFLLPKAKGKAIILNILAI
ncbi:MAG: hypothetical protein U9O59_04020, partial [Actinomycetota bacterium]|nr:hypothetical protein [Actinomycetota bacterium]